MTPKQKQCLLAYLGYYTGEVDGIWGPLSLRAEQTFRLKYGLKADIDTEQALKVAVAGEENGQRWDQQDSFWKEIRYFSREEFRCTCGGRGCNGFPAEPVERLIRNAELARGHFGKPALVSSGVRCALRNGELPGSAANSLHMRGKAMDFCIRGVPAAKVIAYVKTLPEVEEAYAIDDCYIHMGVQKY